MILGIVLHASTAFFPDGGGVQDQTSTSDKWFDELLHAIHGFRMPLFFVLSGFFTTMVWRRRGLRTLLEQRALRVAVPLALGLVTLIPIMNVVVAFTHESAATRRPSVSVLGVESLHHLWFLWFLVLFVAAFAATVTVLGGLSALGVRAGRWAAPTMWLMLPLSAVAHFEMAELNGLMFGPADALTFKAHWTVLVYYGTFFAFGALLWGRTGYRGEPAVRSLGRLWPVSLAVALGVLLPLGLDAVDHHARTATAVAYQVGFTWLMIVGLLGLFRQVLATERFWVRYLSDSSYWLYLAHMPLVILLQYVGRTWDLPPEVKLVGICTVSIGLLLVSYQVAVRYTVVGRLLNGPRTRRTARVGDPAA